MPKPTIKDTNTQSFLRFVARFHKVKLTAESKIQAIMSAKPYSSLFGVISEEYETQKLTESIRQIVDELKSDVKNGRGFSFMSSSLNNDDNRKELVAREILSICQNIDSKYSVPNSEMISKKDCEILFNSNNKTVRKAVDLYFYRVAYFTMTRMLLIRVWEDARFIQEEYVTLFNGGFKKWYDVHNKKIIKVLEQAYSIGREKYEWLFTDFSSAV